MNKQTLRKIYLEKRITLTPHEYSARNQLLLSQVKELDDVIATGPVHIFLPISKFREVNTWPIVEWFWGKGVSTITTITDTKKNVLRHVWLEEQTQLLENKWGIPEPVCGKAADPSKCTVVFVPLIVFDQLLNRIGYGKGFYDIFLSELPSRIKKIGLSLAPPLDVIPYTELHDEQLDAVVWPGGIQS